MLNYQELPRSDYASDFAYIEMKTTREGRYIQLAEELIEAAHACMKVARAMQGESYLQEEMPKLLNNLTEEFTDIEVVKSSLRFKDFDTDVFDRKVNRWVKRLEDAEEFNDKETE